MKLSIHKERWRLSVPFTISRGTMTDADMLVVELEDDGVVGRGEASPTERYNESCDAAMDALEGLRAKIEAGLTVQDLPSLLPAGSARNALDCALWDLACKKAGKRIWDLVNIPDPGSMAIDVTIGIDTPQAMAARAKSFGDFPLLKIKLGKDDPIGRMRAVYNALPHTRFMVDANEAWSVDELAVYAPQLKALGVELIEQPVPAGQDGPLADYDCPLPLCADESCHTRNDLDFLVPRYDYINIKLDKTGGLTEALALARTAQARGMRLMVGCMIGTSLAMAPTYVVAALCAYCDIDAPLLIGSDRPRGIRYEPGKAYSFGAELWG